MKCPKCSQENSDSARYCMHCGAELLEEKPTNYEGPSSREDESPRNEYQSSYRYRAGDRYQPSPGPMDRPPMGSWLVPNIVLTVLSVFTCSCIGLIFTAIGIGFGAQVNGRFRSGDMEGAARAARTARTLFWIGLIVGILTMIAFGIALTVGISFIPSEYWDILPRYDRYWDYWETSAQSLSIWLA